MRIMNPKQIRIGITGGIGSGKSYVARLLSDYWHVPVYDCDTEAKRLTSESKQIRQQLTELVGKELWHDGQMRKDILADYLFASSAHAAQVNAIIHPVVREDFLCWAGALDCPVVAIESAILYESGFYTMVDHVILVEASQNVRLERAMARDGVSKSQVERRMARQQISLAADSATFIIRNDTAGDENLLEQLREVMTKQLMLKEEEPDMRNNLNKTDIQ